MTHQPAPVVADLSGVRAIDAVDVAGVQLLGALDALSRIDVELAAEAAFAFMGELVVHLTPIGLDDQEDDDLDALACGVCGRVVTVGEPVVLVGTDICHKNCPP